MRYLLVLLFLVACGEEEAAVDPLAGLELDQQCASTSALIDEWEDLDKNYLWFGAQCQGYHQQCDVNFTYNKPDGGYIKINVTSDGCVSQGEHIVKMELDESNGKIITLNLQGQNVFYFPRNL